MKGKGLQISWLFAKLAMACSELDGVSYRQEMVGFQKVFSTPSLLKLLRVPGATKEHQKTIIKALIDISGHSGGSACECVYFQRFCRCLVEQNRVHYMAEIARYFITLEDRVGHNGVYHVSSFDKGLFKNAEDRKKLEGFVQKYFRDEKASYRFYEDKGLLAGFVIERGYKKIDASFARVLKELSV